MRNVKELNNEELQELKVQYATETEGRDLSYGEILNINEIVSDEDIYKEYESTLFSDDDFFCNLK